jgi:hypothetical protein
MIKKLQKKFEAREMRYDQYRDIGLSFLTQPREDHRTSDRFGCAQSVAENHLRAICKAYIEWGIFDRVNGDSEETYHDALLIQRDGAIECYMEALEESNAELKKWDKIDRDVIEAKLSTIWNDAMQELYDARVIVDQCVKVCREIRRLPNFIYG